MRRPALILLALLAPLAAGAADTPVAAVVTLPTPPGVDRARLVAEFEQAAPVYARAPGLLRKDFTIGDGTFGGVYLWSSRAAAEAFYSEAFRARSKARFGVEPTIVLFETPVQIIGTNVAATR